MKRLALVSFLFVAAACSDQKEDSARTSVPPAAHAGEAMAMPAVMPAADMSAAPATSHASDMMRAPSATPTGDMKHPEMKDDVKDVMATGAKNR